MCSLGGNRSPEPTFFTLMPSSEFRLPAAHNRPVARRLTERDNILRMDRNLEQPTSRSIDFPLNGAVYILYCADRALFTRDSAALTRLSSPRVPWGAAEECEATHTRVTFVERLTVWRSAEGNPRGGNAARCNIYLPDMWAGFYSYGSSDTCMILFSCHELHLEGSELIRNVSNMYVCYEFYACYSAFCLRSRFLQTPPPPPKYHSQLDVCIAQRWLLNCLDNDTNCVPWWKKKRWTSPRCL